MSKHLSLEVLGSIANVDFLKLKLPGAPSLVAPHYPPVNGSKWYEGSELRSASQLIGRVETLEEIMDSFRFENEAVPRLIALTGIGGIGYFESFVVVSSSVSLTVDARARNLDILFHVQHTPKIRPPIILWVLTAVQIPRSVQTKILAAKDLG